MGIPIKDLDPTVVPSLTHRVPAMLPDGTTVFLTVEQILDLMNGSDRVFGELTGNEGVVRSDALAAQNAKFLLRDEADADKGEVRWDRTSGDVQLLRSAGGILSLHGSGVDDLLLGANKVWNAGNFTPTDIRIATGVVSTNTTEVDITIPTGYRRFTLAIEEARPATNAQGYLALRYKINGTWFTSGYRWATSTLGVSGAAYNDFSIAALTSHMLLVGSTVQDGANSRVRHLVDLFPGDATSWPSHVSRGSLSQSNAHQTQFAAGQYPSQLGRLEGVRILYYNNTIAQLNYELRGIA